MFQATILKQVAFPIPGVFFSWRSNPCLLHWQEGSSPLSHRGSVGAVKWQNLWVFQFYFFLYFYWSSSVKTAEYPVRSFEINLLQVYFSWPYNLYWRTQKCSWGPAELLQDLRTEAVLMLLSATSPKKVWTGANSEIIREKLIHSV